MTRQAEDKTKVQLAQYLEPWSSQSKYFKMLAARLQQQDDEAAAPSRRIGVTSCSSGDGASTVAIQLAAAFCRSFGHSVVLIDANIDCPLFDKTFVADDAPGLLNVLANDRETSDCLCPTTIENLSIMSLGRADWGPLDYSSSRIEDLFASLSEHSDLVIVDLPVAQPTTHWHVLSRQLDGVLLVVASGQTRISAARRARHFLDEANIRLFGVVLNHCPS